MSGLHRWKIIMAGCVAALALAACGGDDNGNGSNAGNGGPVAPPPGSAQPTMTNDIATDGRNWMNYRRAQAGIPEVTQNRVLDQIALAHSEYQLTNNVVSHEQIPGRPGFTGATLQARLLAGGYLFANASYAYGEVISATASRSGFFMAEELITAIYHRFVIFEPIFKEVGTGAATTAAGYTYLTANFAANNGYGPGIGSNIAVWPYSGQTQVVPNFFSNQESPDPVPGINEVGYPISVHANIDLSLTVQNFTVRPRGGQVLEARLLSAATDNQTGASVAAVVPLRPLAAATTYDVSFTGAVGTTPVSKSWSFTTK
jgi:uncharacterized protein YkwD